MPGWSRQALLGSTKRKCCPNVPPLQQFLYRKTDSRLEERISQTSREGSRSRCQLRQRNLSGACYVKDCLARGQQIICDYSSMASPPHRFGAHDGAALRPAELNKPGQTFVKAMAHGVISVVMKARVLPECIDAG